MMHRPQQLARLRTYQRCLIVALIVAFLGVAAGKPLQVRAQDKSRITLFLVVDSSTSMDEHDNPPRRWTAVRMLISALSEGDRFALVSFASTADVFPQLLGSQYGPLITIGKVGQPNVIDKKTLLSDIQQFSSQVARGSTNMLAAFDEVAKLLPQAASDSQPYIVFLTDGEPDAPAGLVDKVKALNVPLYAGGLWPGKCANRADEAMRGQALLEQMAQSTPGGKSECLDSPTAMPAFFLKSLGDLAYRSYQQPQPDGAFEITSDQQDIVETATLIYVNDQSDCRIEGDGSLCVSITDPNGQELTKEQLRQRPDIEADGDEKFLALTITKPSNRWRLGDPANWHIIMRTSLRMDLGVPQAGATVTRQPVNQELSVSLQFWKRQPAGGEEPYVLRDDPVLEVKELSLKQGGTAPVPFDLRSNGAVFNGVIPAQARTGLYIVKVQANVAGFRFLKEQEISIESFPEFHILWNDEPDQLIIQHGQAARLRFEAILNGQPEPVTNLTPDKVLLMCAGQPIVSQLTAIGTTAYDLTFDPPAAQESACQLKIDGTLKHRETAYSLRQDLASFKLTVQAVLRLSAQSQSLGDLLPFERRTLAGPLVKLSAEGGINLSASLKPGFGDEDFDVRISPQTLLQNEEAQLTIELLKRPNVTQKFRNYEVVIVLQADNGVIIQDSNEIRYTFGIVQPKITHQLPATYSLTQPFATWDEIAAAVPLRIEAVLPVTGTLSARVQTASDNLDGQALSGLLPRLTAADTLNDRSIPIAGSREYLLYLEPTATGDPWPQKWFNAQPVAFDVVLDAGQGVQILPSRAIHINGTRLSIIDAFQRDHARGIMLTKNVSIGLSLLTLLVWIIVIYAWKRMTSQQHMMPQDYLVPVTVTQGNVVVDPDDSSVGLGSFYRGLKQQLFGIRLRSVVTSPPRSSWRIWRPAIFWDRLLGAQHPDYKIVDSKPLDFRIYPRDMDEVCEYEIENVSNTPLELLRDRQRMVVLEGNRDILQRGDVILTGEDTGLRLDPEQHILKEDQPAKSLGKRKPPLDDADGKATSYTRRRAPTPDNAGEAGPRTSSRRTAASQPAELAANQDTGVTPSQRAPSERNHRAASDTEPAENTTKSPARRSRR